MMMIDVMKKNLFVKLMFPDPVDVSKTSLVFSA